MLEVSFSRLISTVRETPYFVHSTTSLPDTVDMPTTPNPTGIVETQVGSTPHLPIENRQSCLENGDHHPGKDDPLQTSRVGGAHDNSEQHCPGDEEMPTDQPTLSHDKALSQPQTWHSHRQSLSPSPPSMLNRAVRLMRTLSRNASWTRGGTILTPSNHPFPNFDNHSQEGATAKANTHAPVASQQSPSNFLSPQRLGLEPEGTHQLSPLSTVPEETMDMPTSQKAKQLTIALATSRILLDNMCNNLIICIKHIDRINEE